MLMANRQLLSTIIELETVRDLTFNNYDYLLINYKTQNRTKGVRNQQKSVTINIDKSF